MKGFIDPNDNIKGNLSNKEKLFMMLSRLSACVCSFQLLFFSTMLGLGLAFMIIFALAFGGTASFGYEEAPANAVKFMLVVGVILFVIFYICYVKIYKMLVKNKKFTAVIVLTIFETARIVLTLFRSFARPDTDSPQLSYYIGGTSIFFLILALCRVKLARDMYVLSKCEDIMDKK